MSRVRRKTPLTVLPDLSRQQTADLLNASLTKVDKLIRDKVLDTYKLGPDRRSARRIKRESIERLRAGKP